VHEKEAATSKRASWWTAQVRTWLEAPALIHAAGEIVFRLIGRRESSCRSDLSQASRILVLRLDGIGDVVLTSPFLRQLRRAAPRAKITLVVQPFVRNLVDRCPYVDEVLVFHARAPRFLRPVWQHARALSMAFRQLLPRRFDWAIHPRWDADRSHASFLAYFSGAARRAGYSEHVRGSGARRENRGWDVLLTDACPDSELKHEIHHNAALLRFLGASPSESPSELWPDDADWSLAETMWRHHGVRDRDLVIAFGLGGEPKRQWPIEHFLHVSNTLSRERNATILIVGGPNERDLAEQFQKRSAAKTVIAAGFTTLRETAALLHRAAIYIGNDTGAMHMAAAAEVKVVEISCHPQNGALAHSNSPARFGPVGVEHRILQPKTALTPCVDGCAASEPHCIRAIEPEQVLAAARELMAEAPVLVSQEAAYERR